MEFRIERGELTNAVAWAARVLPTRSPVPVLGGLLLEAADDRLTISGLDYEASARIEVGARTGRPGKVLVMGRRLLDVCKVLPEGPVECAVEGSRFTVKGGDAGFGLSVLPLDDYPALPPLPEILGEVDGQEFAAAVADVSVAAGRDDTLPTLTGIRLGLDGERMTLAATDRYRFAVRTLDWRPASHGVTADVVVSARRLSEIARSVGARPGTVRLALDGGSAGFEREGMRTTVRLLDGRLPRHDKLFLLNGPVSAVTELEPLIEAVKRVAVVADGDSPLQFAFTADSVLLQAGYEDDVASQRLPAALLGADEITVAFNPSYLMDALASFDAPTVRFQLMGQGQRAMLTGHPDHEDAAAAADGAGDTVHQHLLMSVRPLVQ
ncbi:MULTISPECIES: DNA polymerase III subunit beta [unclassified Streptomyces]|uniref:DNA polymerase III subunit beta n=1 Tax=unclassified Streptomyces TaxID=2593676 RepID=UPI000DAD4D97|nr:MULTISPECIES: DNA polymerase III subunit beta [unclassified Streptomyces]PZT72674.1 DNA polymerase III subunit beta [Streptomyces sp. AC1-42T]PZT81007.1 DNA polymerase III subunit beta [Streptomyces sp. AC1-42W]